MSWTNQNALKRVFNVYKRFKEQNGKLWDNDIEAIKTLNTAIENDTKISVNDNLLYAKLLCFILYKNVDHFGGIKGSIKHIQSNILNFTLDEHIEMLRRSLNKNDFDQYLATLGLSEKFTWDDKENNLAILTKNQNEILDKIKKFWDFEKVKKSFHNTANEFLQNVNNYI